jgi:N-acetyltransferase 10
LVKKLLGPYVVFIASTINGYEGTGRSLSLKLLQQLRQQQGSAAKAAADAAADVKGNKGGVKKGSRKLHEERGAGAAEAAAGSGSSSSAGGGRVLREITLQTPIRYAENDAIESWLHEVLCLDIENSSQRLVCGTPAPEDCNLYFVDRDALFSYHKLSEQFLQRMMALYVSSHYKNEPNDLLLMADAPAHQLFVLLGPTAEDGSDGGLPDILCVAQVALEGEITKEDIKSQLARGERPAGDLIPWTVSTQFQDDEFGSLSGARIVRIATHPDVTRMGYGSRVVDLLAQYYQGQLSSPVDDDDEEQEDDSGKSKEESADLLNETVKPRKHLPPLLLDLHSRKPERLHWLGVSFGLTEQLYNLGLGSLVLRGS